MKCITSGERRQQRASPPARGAWIEIPWEVDQLRAVFGRPPHGGRGLKSGVACMCPACTQSPPARGAWIEINRISCYIAGLSVRRPPHGGRGLKYHNIAGAVLILAVAPRTGGVD